jgi:hypothetical protein
MDRVEVKGGLAPRRSGLDSLAAELHIVKPHTQGGRYVSERKIRADGLVVQSDVSRSEQITRMFRPIRPGIRP